MSYRNCVFTLNNYTEEDIEQIKKWNYKYLIFGLEVGEKGTPHIQGYVEWKCSKTLKTLKNLHPKIHWEKRMGTSQQASAYCAKDGITYEDGEISKQGERTDLNAIKEEIMEGKKVDDIAIENPIIYHQYGRTLNKIEDLIMRKKYRKEMTKGIWIWGATGVGKSHKAFEHYNPESCYVLPDDNGWWDAYTQQESVIINDFRGEIPYNQLLQLVDKYPYSVRRRNREPMPFTSAKVIITSSLPPEKVYHKRCAEDKIDQLTRRFDVIHLT